MIAWNSMYGKAGVNGANTSSLLMANVTCHLVRQELMALSYQLRKAAAFFELFAAAADAGIIAA